MRQRSVDPQVDQPSRLRRLARAALVLLPALAFTTDLAEARHRFHHAHAPRHVNHSRHAHHAAWRHRSYGSADAYSPAFSALVVDVNSGRTLYAVAEDGPRHPASITKVMTLYLLFERLDSGAITLQTRIPISEHAAAQEPSKLGLDPGETISVENAIKAVVTRSANDIAVAIAEAIGGSENNFADMMTRKARALGMQDTVYRNASGLPNDEQVTTARDLALLGRSLEERFPRYFSYFSTHEFVYAGQVIGNHNHLLGRIDGVDGIKTGYTRSSGFNLLTSVHRDGRSLIAVVMGGRTSRGRDRIMENLIEDHIAEASTVHTATMVADGSKDAAQEERPAQPRPKERPRLVAVAARVPAREPSARLEQAVAEGDDSEEGDGQIRVAALIPPVIAPRSAERRPPAPRAAEEGSAAPSPEKTASIPAARGQRTPAQLGWVKGLDSAQNSDEGGRSAPPTPPMKPRLADAAASEPARAPRAGAEDESSRPRGKGWIIQIGATDDAAKATALLARARERNRAALGAAKPLTEKVRKGEDVFYRARFAGLDSASAESACRSLKRTGFSCFAAPD